MNGSPCVCSSRDLKVTTPQIAVFKILPRFQKQQKKTTQQDRLSVAWQFVNNKTQQNQHGHPELIVCLGFTLSLSPALRREE